MDKIYREFFEEIDIEFLPRSQCLLASDLEEDSLIEIEFSALV